MSGQYENTSQPMDLRVRRWQLVRRVLIAVAVLAGAVVIAVVFDPYGEVISPWVWGPCILVVCVCGVFAAVAGGKAREASFTGAHSSTGTVVEVIEIPASGDYNARYVFNIEAELPDGTTLHRNLDMGGWPEPLSWAGKQIWFRHNTIAPDDLDDAFFGREEYLATIGEVEP